MKPLPRGKFGAILIDPPWRFETWSKAGQGRAPKYKTMTFRELAEMPIASLAAPDCVLFLWMTWPMLPQALKLIEVWGFKYSTCAFAWMKGTSPSELSIGTGYWTRANTEVCLLATRGHPKRIGRDIPQAILEPRREHSRKPDCVHWRIKYLVKGRYLELFARQRRKNWVSWGLEVDKFKDGR